MIKPALSFDFAVRRVRSSFYGASESSSRSEHLPQPHSRVRHQHHTRGQQRRCHRHGCGRSGRYRRCQCARELSRHGSHHRSRGHHGDAWRVHGCGLHQPPAPRQCGRQRHFHNHHHHSLHRLQHHRQTHVQYAQGKPRCPVCPR